MSGGAALLTGPEDINRLLKLDLAPAERFGRLQQFSQRSIRTLELEQGPAAFEYNLIVLQLPPNVYKRLCGICPNPT